MKFSDDMIGKRVRDNKYPDETGAILGKAGSFTCADDDGVWVRWTTGGFSGSTMFIELGDVTFIDPEPEIQEITINGKRYNLTLIKD